MATAPVYSSALIQALRSAASDSQGVPSGVVLLPNSQDIGLPINFVRSPRTGLAFNPPVLRLPTVAPPPRTSPPAVPPPKSGPVTPPPAVAKPVVPVNPPVKVDDPVVDQPVVDDPVSITFPVTEPPTLTITDLLPLLPEDTDKTPSVTVNEVDVTDTPAPPTDAEEDFEIDRELGLVQQSDVIMGPKTLTPVNTTTTRTPSVTVNEVGLSDTVAPPTDATEDFEIDRELGLVQQSDVFMGQPTQADTGTITQADTAPTSQTNDRLISNVGNVTVADIEDFSDYADLLNTDITSTLPAAVPTPEASNELTDQDLMELALFDLMAQEALTRRLPVPFNTTQRA